MVFLIIVNCVEQIFRTFLFNIRNYSPEVTNVQQREAELKIIFSRVNNFDIKQEMYGIFVLLYAINTKQDLGRLKLTKHRKVRSKYNVFLQTLNYEIFKYNS